MQAMLPSDAINARRIETLYEHFKEKTGDVVAASNLALATIEAGLEAVKPGEVLTVQEAADRLKVSEDTLYELTSSGKLQSMKISTGAGRRPSIRIPLAALLKYQDESAGVQPKPDAGRSLRHLRVR